MRWTGRTCALSSCCAPITLPIQMRVPLPLNRPCPPYRLTALARSLSSAWSEGNAAAASRHNAWKWERPRPRRSCERRQFPFLFCLVCPLYITTTTPGPDTDPLIKIGHVLVHHADAASNKQERQIS